jgi:hypothetical protein
MYKRLILIFLLVMISLTTAFAWDDCLHGEVDCLYPGECPKYIDTDNDGICDHSQPAPEDREVEVVADSEPVAEEPEVVAEVEDAETGSAKKDGSMDKILLAVGIVVVHLVAILLYVKFKKNR